LRSSAGCVVGPQWARHCKGFLGHVLSLVHSFLPQDFKTILVTAEIHIKHERGQISQGGCAIPGAVILPMSDSAGWVTLSETGCRARAGTRRRQTNCWPV
jgi:hypothetical protein